MISLLLIAQTDPAFANIKRIFGELSKTTENPKQLEVIVKFGSEQECAAFRTYVKESDIAFRALGITVVRRLPEIDGNADYNDCYLHAVRESKMLLPLTDNAQAFAPGWDTALHEAYAKAKTKLGHGYFTLQHGATRSYGSLQEAAGDTVPLVAVTRAWADATCGFGLVSQIGGWARGIHYYLQSVHGLEANIAVASAPCDSGRPEKGLTELPPPLQAICRQLAKTLFLVIEAEHRAVDIAYSLRNHTLVDAVYAVGTASFSQKMYHHAYTRYVPEASPYVIRLHTYPLAEAMYCVALDRRGHKENDYKVPTDWVRFIPKWEIRDMNPFPNNDPLPVADTKETL